MWLLRQNSSELGAAVNLGTATQGQKLILVKAITRIFRLVHRRDSEKMDGILVSLPLSHGGPNILTTTTTTTTGSPDHGRDSLMEGGCAD